MAHTVKGNSPSSKIKPLKQAASVWGMKPTAAVIRALQQDGRAMTQHDCPFSRHKHPQRNVVMTMKP